MKIFYVDGFRLYAGFFGQGQQPEQGLGEEGRYPKEIGGNVVVRIRVLLEEVGRHAARVATTMVIAGSLMAATIVRGQVILHAYHAVVMMVMRNNGYHQHNHADDEQEVSDVPFLFHSSVFVVGQR